MHLIPSLGLSLTPVAPDVVSVVGGGGKSGLIFRLAREIVDRGQRSLITTTTRVSMRQVENAPAVVRGHGDDPPWDELVATLDEHGFCLLVGAETVLNGKQAGVSAAMIERLAENGQQLDLAAILVEADGSRTLPVKAPADHEPVLPSCTTLLVPMLGIDAVGAAIDEVHVHRPERIRAVLALPPHEALRLTPALAAQLLVHPQGGAKSRPQGATLLPVVNKADAPERLAIGRLIASQLVERNQPALIAAVGNEQRDPVCERWAPLAAVVLAAGASSRMGRPKQLEVVNGETMVVRATRLALESGASQVVVVTGAHAAAAEAALGPLRQESGGRVRLVYNSDWAQGQASSMAAGIHALSVQCAAAIFLPVDQPFAPLALIRRLVAAWRNGYDLAAPMVDGVLRGAPALFARRFWSELLAVQGDVGGRSVLQQHSRLAAAIPAAAATLRDIDTPSDL